jgi:hypothetical protein
MLDGHGALLLWLSDGPGALDAVCDSLNPLPTRHCSLLLVPEIVRKDPTG